MNALSASSSRRSRILHLLSILGIMVSTLAMPSAAGPPVLSLIKPADVQPLLAQVRRLVEAGDYLGIPFSAAERRALEAALQDREGDEQTRAARIQAVLDPHCLVGIQINPESRVKVTGGPAARVLTEKGWRQFLVKVHNQAGVTAELRVTSPHAQSVHDSPWQRTASDRQHGGRRPLMAPLSEAERWLDLQMYAGQPFGARLNGFELEYRIVQLYSRDAGQREARLAFDVGQGTQDLGFRAELDLLFDCVKATPVTFRVMDHGGEPTTAGFVIRDAQRRVHPSQAKRRAPDFAFHPQVYRTDGEVELLPPGEYTIEYGRGPEYYARSKTVRVGSEPQSIEFQLERWIDPARMGYWSGDHHIHAAGCAHFTTPSEGVHAVDMIRHCLGEDLKVGANLTWGPCFDYQKQFFTGEDDPVSTYPYLLRYDIEVSGFGSHQSGHLCLLRLRDQIYPGGDSLHHWPTLGLNTLRWARKQGAVSGPAHSGWGLEVRTADLPNYIVPPFDGIGANEYIVDVTHEVPGPDGRLVPAVDFISTVDTPYVWELNIWYHTLNVGFRTRISGETDFPCIYGERVGLGRSYVRIDGELNYDDWCEGIREGRNYVGDGRSHLIDFRVNDVLMGQDGSELQLPTAANVRVNVRAAALLNEQPDLELREKDYAEKPYWHIERARIGDSLEVPVEVLVNGEPVARQRLAADGALRDLTFDVPIERSSWVAVRILPSSHTNPVFVVVDGKPIRASRRSATWCLESVDQCWTQKERFIAAAEMEDALNAYEHARQTYRRLIAECDVD
jgi:hypothetical protein